MISNKFYFQNLDAIRFFAACIVFFSHSLTDAFQYLPNAISPIIPILNVICNGATGVSIFFVLSGFLITYLLISEYEKNGKIEITKFYMRRVLRIWPLYYAVVIFSFFLYPFLKYRIGLVSPDGANVFMHLIFLSNFDVLRIENFCPGTSNASQGITWSVSIEEQFYLFWPLIFKFFNRKKWIYGIVLVALTSILFRVIYHNQNNSLYFHSLAVLMDLAIGGLFAYLIKTNYAILTFFKNRSTKFHLITLLITFLLLYFSPKFYDLNYGIALIRIPISICFAFFIAGQALTNKSSCLNLKNLKLPSYFGKYTYGIYLLHPIILMLLRVALRLLSIEINTLWTSIGFTFIGLILTCIIAKFVYQNFELKFLNLKEKYNPTN